MKRFRLRLSGKIIVSVGVLCAVFSCIALFTQYNQYRDTYRLQQEQDVKAGIANADEYMLAYIQQMQTLVISASAIDALKTGTPEEISEALYRFAEQHGNMVRCVLYVTADGEVYSSKQVVYQILFKTMQYRLPREMAASLPVTAAVRCTEPYRSSMITENTMAFYQGVYDHEKRLLGTMMLEVDLKYLSQWLQRMSFLEHRGFLVVSEQGHVVCERMDTPIFSQLKNDILASERGASSISGYPLSLYRQRISTRILPLDIIVLLDESALRDTIMRMCLDMIKTLAILMVGLAFSCALTIRRFVRPLNRLSNTINAVSSENLLADDTAEKGGDEIEELSRNFFNMLDRINRLNDERFNMERDRMRAEIKALQNQLNPHFLYNTLNTIGALVRQGHTDNVPQSISSLIHLLSMYTDKTNMLLTIRDELYCVNCYVDIMSLRYPNRFDVSIQIPANMMALEIPKLTLQPIVDNAIFHGLSSRKEHGLLIIDGYISEGDAVLSVTDNGAGISPERCDGLLSADGAGGKTSSTGLRNTHDRLRLLYGDGYGLSVSSEPDVGTSVIIRLPARPLAAATETDRS